MQRTLLKKKAATYSPALRCSTIGVPGLNFSVRDGKRWNPGAKATKIFRLDVDLGTEGKKLSITLSLFKSIIAIVYTCCK